MSMSAPAPSIFTELPAQNRSKARVIPFTFQALFAAVLLTSAQTLLAMLLSGESNLKGAYATLCRFDGGWFRGVVEGGYRSGETLTRSDPGNTAFFPGYPSVARVVKQTFGIESDAALLATSQVACIGF